MKKIFIMATALCLSVMAVSAQQPGYGGFHHRHGRSYHHHRRDLTKELNFTDQQKQQLKTINSDFRTKMAELNKNENITVKEMRDKRAALLKEQRTAFQNLLTPEQKTKLEDMRKKGEARQQEMAAKHLENMKTRLGLSDDQTAKIKNINDGFRSQLQKFRDNQSLNRSDKRDQFMALVKQRNDNIKSVLTPEQYDKMQDLRKQRMERSF
jgi:Spy/CpxP family protein refolding chaperone